MQISSILNLKEILLSTLSCLVCTGRSDRPRRLIASNPFTPSSFTFGIVTAEIRASCDAWIFWTGSCDDSPLYLSPRIVGVLDYATMAFLVWQSASQRGLFWCDSSVFPWHGLPWKEVEALATWLSYPSQMVLRQRGRMRWTDPLSPAKHPLRLERILATYSGSHLFMSL